MGMHRFKKRSAGALLVVMLAACGDESGTAAGPCPDVEGDRHVAEALSEPDGLPVMLHVVGRACARAGANVFRVYPTSEDLAPALTPAHAGETHALTLTRVSAEMPAMGHGTAEAPKIVAEDEFSVAFQMPGEWRVSIEYATGATSAAQSAAFTVTVQ